MNTKFVVSASLSLLLGAFGFTASDAEAQGCSNLPLELFYKPNLLELKNADEPFCLIPRDGKVDAVIPIVLDADFDFTPSASTFRAVRNTGEKYGMDEELTECDRGFRFGTRLVNPGLLFVGVRKLGAVPGETACFDLVAENIGRLDPRARVVRSLVAAEEAAKSAKEVASLLLQTTIAIITEAYGLDPADLNTKGDNDYGDWVWEDEVAE